MNKSSVCLSLSVLLLCACPMAVAQDSPVVKAPDLALCVSVHHKVTGRQAILHQQVRDHLNKQKLGVPDNRLPYFAARMDLVNSPIGGWSGTILDVRPGEVGLIVDISVGADLGSVGDNLHLIEHYSLIKGKVTYLGTSEPPPYYRFRVGA